MKDLAATSLGTETGRSVLATPLAALVLFLFFCLPCLAPAASADAPQAPALSGRVNDLAGMMSPQARTQVEGILADLERTDSTQVAVLTVPSLEGDSIEDFSLKVAEKWGLGQKGKDNGALILVARDEHKMRIEVGYGLEGRLTDLLSGRIVDSVMAPHFKAGDFDGGFVAGATAVAQAVRGEFKAKPVTRMDKRLRSLLSSGAIIGVMLIIFLMSDIIDRLLGRFGVPDILGRRRGSQYYFPGKAKSYSDTDDFGGDGQGIITLQSVKDFFSDETSSSHSGSTGFGGGGGFSGGGGGFGGGGASGRW